MDIFSKIWEKISPVTSGNKQIILEEIWEKSYKEHEDLQNWVKGSRHKKHSFRLLTAYQNSKDDKQQEIPFTLLQSNGADGFALEPSTTIPASEFVSLQLWLSEKLSSYGYRLTDAHRKITEKEKVVTILKKHYLKPPFPKDFSSIDQQFGNITLSVESHNDKISYFKLLATSYEDRNYQKAIPFDELINFLFKNPANSVDK